MELNRSICWQNHWGIFRDLPKNPLFCPPFALRSRPQPSVFSWWQHYHVSFLTHPAP